MSNTIRICEKGANPLGREPWYKFLEGELDHLKCRPNEEGPSGKTARFDR